MTANIVFVLALAAVGAALFALPHHRRPAHYSTLYGTLAGLLTSEPATTSRAMLMKLLIAIGCVSVLLPPCLALLAIIVPPDGRRTVLIVGGVALLIGGALTFLVEVVSDLSIGFGGGGSSHTETPVFFLAPLWPIACGVAAILAGAMNLGVPWR
jgi:hypothetical protein